MAEGGAPSLQREHVSRKFRFIELLESLLLSDMLRLRFESTSSKEKDMANNEHLNKFYSGVMQWNQWRQENPTIRPDLSGGNFSREAIYKSAFTTGIVSGGLGVSSVLDQQILRDGDLSNVDFRGANFHGRTLEGTNLRGADLSGADLTYAQLIETHLDGAKLQGCRIYGISAWNVHLTKAHQLDLIVTPPNEPIITVDNLEVAQFIYLLLNNARIRDVINTITSKVVLILGRFTKERKQVLNAQREALRQREYLPVLFDFEKPAHRDITETISMLAHMARFVIADITDARSIPQELERIIPNLPSVPVQPLLLTAQQEYGMFEHFRRYSWVLDPFFYDDETMLLAALNEKIIVPAEAKAKEQTAK